uniref:Uncharacterized protein n=1 Tax=Lotus japonicus TaxID=34305 RepID=I3SIH7_LOTJA|nr:unknown [Lotus japonicus]
MRSGEIIEAKYLTRPPRPVSSSDPHDGSHAVIHLRFQSLRRRMGEDGGWLREANGGEWVIRIRLQGNGLG